MKYVYLIVTALYSLCSDSQEIANNILEPTNPQVEVIFEQLLKEDLGHIIKSDDQSLIINISEINNVVFKVSFMPKEHFGWLLENKTTPMYGVWLYKENPIVVFGDAANVVFDKTDETITYQWVKRLEYNQKDQVVIQPSWDMPVWLYTYLDDSFRFESVGVASLL